MPNADRRFLPRRPDPLLEPLRAHALAKPGDPAAALLRQAPLEPGDHSYELVVHKLPKKNRDALLKNPAVRTKTPKDM